MRLLPTLLIALAATGCGDRRSFDERYEDTSRELENRAERLDANLANAEAPEQGADGAGGRNAN